MDVRIINDKHPLAPHHNIADLGKHLQLKKLIKARRETETSLSWFSQANLYGEGWDSVGKPSFVIAASAMTFSLLPESIIKWQTFIPTVQPEWKRLCR